MTIDLAPVVQALLALALPALTTLAGMLAAYAIKHIRLQNNALLSAQIAAAARRGAGLAFQFLAANAATMDHVAIGNVAIAQGANYVAAAFPEALAALGVTPEHVSAMVQAELGRLLAAQPAKVAA
ncbi:MAG TPA: hypothetical protein VMU82_15900 [Acetobacteraceae bacterium]|nr:hypothetical protein [Acetobacteraceae bacterium]